MAPVGRALGRIARWLAACLALGAAILLLVFMVPRLVVNAAAFGLGARVARSFGFDARWDELTVAARSPGFWRKSLAIDATNLCLRTRSGSIDGCFDRLQLAVAGDVSPRRPQLTVLGPVAVRSRALRVQVAPRSTPPRPAPSLADLRLPSWLAGTRLEPIDIQLANLDVATTPLEVTGAVSLHVTPVPTAPGRAAVQAQLDTAGLCMKRSPLGIDGCLSTLRVVAQLGMGDDGLRLTALGPARLEAHAVGVTLAEAPTPPPALASAAIGVDDGSFARLPRLLAGVELRPIVIQLGRVEVRRAAFLASTAADLSVVPSGELASVTLRLGHPCVKTLSVQSCFAHVSAQARLSYKDSAVRLVTLGPIVAGGGVTNVGEGAAEPASAPAGPVAPVASPAPRSEGRPSAGGSTPGPAPPSGLVWVPAWLQAARLAPVEINVARINVRAGERRFLGKGTLNGGETVQGVTLRLHVDGLGALSATLPIKTLVADVQARSERRGAAALGGPVSAVLVGRGALGGGSVVAVKADVRQGAADALLFTVAGRYDHRPGRVPSGSGPAALAAKPGVVSATASGSITARELDTTLAARARGFLPALAEVDLRRCRVTLAWPESAGGDGRVRLGCHVAAVLPPQAGLVPATLRLPQIAEVAVDGVLTAPLPPGPDGLLRGHVHAELVPPLLSDLTASAQLTADLAGTLAAPAKTLHLPLSLRAAVAVPHFERLVQELAATRYAVPAPFQVLAGRLTASTTWHGDPLHEPIVLPIAASTRLAGADEVVAIDVAGHAGLAAAAAADRRPSVVLDVRLREVTLELPPFHLLDGSFPQVLPDGRVGKSPPLPPRVAASPLAYRVRIHTGSDQPLQLRSNLAKTPLRLRVDVTATADRPVAGDVVVAPVELNLFKRKAVLDQVVVRLAGDQSQVDGQAHVEFPDYVVRVLTTGPLARPVVKLVSDPPRPQRDLAMSLLSSAGSNNPFAGDHTQADAKIRSAEDEAGTLSLEFLALLAAAGGTAPGVAH